MALFIGFMDGDGYFDIGEQKQYNKKSKVLVRSTIRIRLASNVHVRDRSLLEYFVKVLGVGKISTMSGGREQVRVIFSKKDLGASPLPPFGGWGEGRWFYLLLKNITFNF